MSAEYNSATSDVEAFYDSLTAFADAAEQYKHEGPAVGGADVIGDADGLPDAYHDRIDTIFEEHDGIDLYNAFWEFYDDEIAGNLQYAGEVPEEPLPEEEPEYGEDIEPESEDGPEPEAEPETEEDDEPAAEPATGYNADMSVTTRTPEDGLWENTIGWPLSGFAEQYLGDTSEFPGYDVDIAGPDADRLVDDAAQYEIEVIGGPEQLRTVQRVDADEVHIQPNDEGDGYTLHTPVALDHFFDC